MRNRGSGVIGGLLLLPAFGVSIATSVVVLTKLKSKVGSARMAYYSAAAIPVVIMIAANIYISAHK